MERDILLHEAPVGLDMRPMVVIRPAPGVALRAPTRAVIVVGVALMIWCVALMIGAPWAPALVAVALPAALLAWVAEGRVHGRRPLAWAWAVIQHHVRPSQLVGHGWSERGRMGDAGRFRSRATRR